MPKRPKRRRERRANAAHPDVFELMVDNTLWLFGMIVAACVSLVVAVFGVRGTSRSELWDKVLYVGCGVIAAAATIYVLIRPDRQRRPGVSVVIATVGLVIGIGAIESHDAYPREMLRGLWHGWGPTTLALTVLLSVTGATWRIIAWSTLPRLARAILAVIAGAICIGGALTLWQGRTSLVEPNSAEFYLNELLAPAAGRIPYRDFIPQYQTLYSWLLVPLAHGRSVNQLLEIALIGLNLLAFLAVGLGVWLAHQSLQKRSLVLAVLFVVPLTCVVPFPYRETVSGSIASQLSGLPTRIVIGMLVGALAASLFHQMRRNRVLIARMAFLGVAGGLYVCNSQEFGPAANLTVLFLLATVPGPTIRNRFYSLAAWLIGLAVGLVAYPVTAAIAGRPLDPHTFFFFVRQFSSGFGAEPIEIPGPVMVILPLTMATTMASLHILWGIRGLPESAHVERTGYAATVGAFFGAWSTVGLVYYLNRSFASGQMQVIFLPLSVALASLIGAVTVTGNPASRAKSRSSESTDARIARYLAPLTLLPLTLCASLLFTSGAGLLNPAVDLRRLRQPGDSLAWPTVSLQTSVREAPAALEFARKTNRSVAYFGEGGNYLQLATGMASINVFNHPHDLLISKQVREFACRPIERSGPDLILFSDAAVDAFVIWGDQRLCGTYGATAIPGVRTARIAMRVK